MLKNIIIFTLLFVVTYSSCQAKDKFAVIVSLQGDVMKRCGNEKWNSAKKKELLRVGDAILTKKGSKASLFLEGLAIIKVGENSHIILKRRKKELTRWVVEIKKGRVWVELQKFLSEGDIELETPYGSAIVKGSIAEVEVKDSSLDFTLHEGTAEVVNKEGTKPVGEGEKFKVTPDRIERKNYTIDQYTIEMLKEKTDSASLLAAFREKPDIFLKPFVLWKKEDYVLRIYLLPGEKRKSMDLEARKKLASRFVRKIDTRLFNIIKDGVKVPGEEIELKSKGYFFRSPRYLFFGKFKENRGLIEKVLTAEFNDNPYNVTEGKLEEFSVKDLVIKISTAEGKKEIAASRYTVILPKNKPLKNGENIVILGRKNRARIIFIK